MQHKSLRKWHEARLAELKTRRAAFDGHWAELRAWIDTRQGQLQQGERRVQAGLNKEVINTAARKALRTSTAGLSSGMTSPSRPWFRLSAGEDAKEDAAARDWLQTVQLRMGEVFSVSNLYQALPIIYRDLLQFGTGAMLVLQDFDDVVRFMNIPVGRFWVAYDKRGRPVSLYRELQMNVQQLVEEFGEDAVSTQVREAFARGEMENRRDVVHVIARRTAREPGSPLAKDKPWASLWWEQGENGDKLLEESGFGHATILAPRWDVYGDEEYGLSPGMDALADAKSVQVQERDLAEARHRLNRPTLTAPGSLRKASRRMKQFPGGVIYQSAADMAKGGVQTLHTVDPRGLEQLRIGIAECVERIQEGFFADLFMMFANIDRRQITAEEIARRYEEKLLALGPVLERLHDELLKPLIDIVFEIMVAADLIPPPPETMAGREFGVEFVSMLAQAQKAVGLVSIERFLGVGGMLANLGRPDAMDKIDADQVMDEAHAMLGAAAGILRSDADVARTREARAREAQQQQALQMAQPLAQSAKLVTEAAERADAVLP